MRLLLPAMLTVTLVSGCGDSREPTAQPAKTPQSSADLLAAPAAPKSTPPPAAAPAPVAAPAAAAPAPAPAAAAPAPAAQPVVVAPPPAHPPATLARASVGEPRWIPTAGWKGGPAEHGNPAVVRVLAESDGAGARAIEVTFTGGAKDKAVVSHALVKEDLAPHPGLAFTVSNPGEQPVQIAIALKTGKGWLYHESKVSLIPARTAAPVALSYDLEDAVFRTLATKWQPTSTIADLGELKEVQVVILNGAQSGVVVIADVRIIEQVAK